MDDTGHFALRVSLALCHLMGDKKRSAKRTGLGYRGRAVRLWRMASRTRSNETFCTHRFRYESPGMQRSGAMQVAHGSGGRSSV